MIVKMFSKYELFENMFKVTKLIKEPYKNNLNCG